MFGYLIKGFFFLGLISWYSSGVFKLINDYFRYEYKAYLTEEMKRNKNLRLSPESEVSTDMPTLEKVKDSRDSSLEDFKPLISIQEVKTCKADHHHSLKELDYFKQEKTNERQSQDDEFTSYWLERRTKDNSDLNLYCKADCQDNVA